MLEIIIYINSNWVCDYVFCRHRGVASYSLSPLVYLDVFSLKSTVILSVYPVIQGQTDSDI